MCRLHNHMSLPLVCLFMFSYVSCAQVIQVPIALAATIGNVFFVSSDIDLTEVFKLGRLLWMFIPVTCAMKFLGLSVVDWIKRKCGQICAVHSCKGSCFG